MRFCIFSDLHLSAYPSKLEEFVSFIKEIDEKVDGYICAGDWTSIDFRELDKYFGELRNATNKTVLTVFGNHCHWVGNRDVLSTSLDEIFEYHSTVCKKHNIIFLQEDYFETDSLFIGGYNGWYGTLDTFATKDYLFIPSLNSFGGTNYQVLKKKESDALFGLLNYAELIKDKKKVCVTHFGFTGDVVGEKYRANPRYFNEFIKNNFDVLIFGHSHKKEDFLMDGCRLINPGADYVQPVSLHYLIIDL